LRGKNIHSEDGMGEEEVSQDAECGAIRGDARGNVVIHCPLDVNCLGALAEQAAAEGFGMVSKLVGEWESEQNRFDKSGEQSYLAIVEGVPCGVCGLNIDPYAGAGEVGRVRRLYVIPAMRRMGIGSALLRRLANDSVPHFSLIRVRTHEAAASKFYESLGFQCVTGDAFCTHELMNDSRSGGRSLSPGDFD
jgi:GNAT superfamily N-acetyltransferase